MDARRRSETSWTEAAAVEAIVPKESEACSTVDGASMGGHIDLPE